MKGCDGRFWPEIDVAFQIPVPSQFFPISHIPHCTRRVCREKNFFSLNIHFVRHFSMPKVKLKYLVMRWYKKAFAGSCDVHSS